MRSCILLYLSYYNPSSHQDENCHPRYLLIRNLRSVIIEPIDGDVVNDNKLYISFHKISKIERIIDEYIDLNSVHEFKLVNWEPVYVKWHSRQYVFNNQPTYMNYIWAFSQTLHNGKHRFKCTPYYFVKFDSNYNKMFVTIDQANVYVGDYISFTDSKFENGVVKVNGGWLYTLSSNQIVGRNWQIFDNMSEYFKKHLVKYNIPTNMHDKIDKLIMSHDHKLLKLMLKKYVSN